MVEAVFIGPDLYQARVIHTKNSYVNVVLQKVKLYIFHFYESFFLFFLWDKLKWYQVPRSLVTLALVVHSSKNHWNEDYLLYILKYIVQMINEYKYLGIILNLWSL